MVASPDLLLAIALCLLLRLAGHAQPFENHPVLAPFFRVDALYLDSVLLPSLQLLARSALTERGAT